MEKKTIKKVVAGCLALVCMATAGITAVATNGFGTYGSEQDMQAATSEDVGSVIGANKSNGIKLMNTVIAAADYEEYGISPLAETAQLLTATVNPTNATNKAVTWSIAWKNASSTWAKSKSVTDYVTVTPTSTGANTATVECLQAFGEQVIVTVTSEDNADATASCTVDYAERLETRTYKFTNISDMSTAGEFSTGESGTLDIKLDDSVIFSAVANSTAYTVDDTFEATCTVEVNASVLAELNTATGLSITAGALEDTCDGVDNSKQCSVFNFLNLLEGVDWTNEENYNKLNNWLMENANKSLFTFSMTYEGTYSSFTDESSIYFNADGLEVRVESVTLDQGSLIF